MATDFLAKIPNNLRVSCDIYEYPGYQDVLDRRLYLSGAISYDNDAFSDPDVMSPEDIVQYILQFNREDKELKPEERKPIRLYINSPGGDIEQGFPIVSAIQLSRTPVYTINVGEWASMAFLIGITGHRRFSLPYMQFLMHDGSNFILGSTGKVQDQADFNKRFEKEVVKRHVLSHSKISEKEYDKRFREEWYMLPEDALEKGFIDHVVTSLDEIF